MICLWRRALKAGDEGYRGIGFVSGLQISPQLICHGPLEFVDAISPVPETAIVFVHGPKDRQQLPRPNAMGAVFDLCLPASSQAPFP